MAASASPAPRVKREAFGSDSFNCWLILARRAEPKPYFPESVRVPGPLLMVIPFKQLWFIARAGHLKVGDPAPDFNLPTADEKAQVQLSSFRQQKPVVLIFGSYT